MIAAGLICVLYVVGAVCMTMLLPTSEIFAYTGTLDALAKASELLGVPQVLVQILRLVSPCLFWELLSCTLCSR